MLWQNKLHRIVLDKFFQPNLTFSSCFVNNYQPSHRFGFDAIKLLLYVTDGMEKAIVFRLVIFGIDAYPIGAP